MSEALNTTFEGLAVDTVILFKGYTDLPEGEEPLFSEGEQLTITEVTEDGGYICVNADGNTDTVFPEEVKAVVGGEEGEEAEAPLDPKTITKGDTIDVVDAEGNTVVTGEVEAKTAAALTVAGVKYPVKSFTFYAPAAEETAEEEEAEAEQPLDPKALNKGDVVDVVDADGNTVASGVAITAKTATIITCGADKYAVKNFFFYAPAEAEVEAGSEEETSAEDQPLEFSAIVKGMDVDVVDADGHVVASGVVSAKNVKGGTVTVNGTAYGKDFFVYAAEEEQAPEQEQVAAPAKPAAKAPAKAAAPAAKPAAKAKPAAPAAKPAAKAAHEAAEALEIVNTESLAAILADQDALTAAKEVVQQIEEGYFNLGGLLAHIQQEELYQQAGYEGNQAFDRYVADELGIDYRKAMYLIKIYTHFSQLGVDESRLSEIGWSKAKELVGVATVENFDELVDFATEHSRTELQEHIKTTYQGGSGRGTGTGEPAVRKTTFKFAAFEDQANVILAAIEQAKEQHGITDDGEAMIVIMTEWASLVDGMDIPMEVAKDNFESRYGVSLTIGDAKPAETKAPVKAAAAPAKPAAQTKAPAKPAAAAKAPAKPAAPARRK